MTKYCPVGYTKDGAYVSHPPARLSQRKRGQQETPRMTTPVKYERPGKKTRS